MTPKSGPKKEKYICLAPEEIEVGVTYTLTINPSDDYQYFNSDERVSNVCKYVRNFIISGMVNDVIWLKLEISKAGRLHFHGTIYFHSKNTIRNFFENKVHYWQKVCTYEIDVINDMKLWLAYCTKQSLYTEVVTNEVKINDKIKNPYKKITEY